MELNTYSICVNNYPPLSYLSVLVSLCSFPLSSINSLVPLSIILPYLMGKRKQQSGSEEDVPEESFSQQKKKKSTPKKKPAPKKPATPKKDPPKMEQPKKATPAKGGKETTAKKEDKKKDYLPGQSQKYPMPDEDDGALAFYKSLFDKNPRSEMARRYCLEYGVLQPADATRLVKELGRKK